MSLSLCVDFFVDQVTQRLPPAGKETATPAQIPLLITWLREELESPTCQWTVVSQVLGLLEMLMAKGLSKEKREETHQELLILLASHLPPTTRPTTAFANLVAAEAASQQDEGGKVPVPLSALTVGPEILFLTTRDEPRPHCDQKTLEEAVRLIGKLWPRGAGVLGEP